MFGSSTYLYTKVMAYQTELTFAIDLARRMGELIRNNLQVGHDFSFKRDGSTITKLDTTINRLVIETVQQTYPDDGILGEEQSAMTGKEKRLWVVDPVDGTFPFKSGIPTSCVLLALLDEYQPVLGVTYNPHVDQLFMAVRGQGAFVQDRHGKRQVRVNEHAALHDAPVGVTGSISGTELDIPHFRAALEDAGGRPQILGSTGYEIAMVGAGQFDGQVFGYTTRHDIAAGAVFVTEAGGKATDLTGAPLDFRKPLHGAIISNGFIHKDLQAIAKRFIR